MLIGDSKRGNDIDAFMLSTTNILPTAVGHKPIQRHTGKFYILKRIKRVVCLDGLYITEERKNKAENGVPDKDLS